MLKAMTVRLSDEMYKEVRIKLAHEGSKFQEYILKLIKKDLEEKQSKEESVNI